MNTERTMRHLREDMESAGLMFSQMAPLVFGATRLLVDGETIASLVGKPNPLALGKIVALAEPLLVVDGDGAVLMIPGVSYDHIEYMIYIDVAGDTPFGVFMMGSVAHSRPTTDGMIAFRLRRSRYALRNRTSGWLPSPQARAIEASVERVIKGDDVTYEQRREAEIFLNDFKNNMDEAMRQLVAMVELGRIRLPVVDLDVESEGRIVEISNAELLARTANPPKA